MHWVQIAYTRLRTLCLCQLKGLCSAASSVSTLDNNDRQSSSTTRKCPINEANSFDLLLFVSAGWLTSWSFSYLGSGPFGSG